MTYKPTLKRVFFALIIGIFLVYAIGGAAIASATISGHTALVQGIVNFMVSAGMTWLMAFGIPLVVLVSYHVYVSWYDFLTSVADSIRDAFSKGKNEQGHDRLSLSQDETEEAYIESLFKFEETER